jgi:DNA (cytosine-5)-methyltransferase 1
LNEFVVNRLPEGRRNWVATNGVDYGPAIHRWERVTGREAPSPTEPGDRGNRRLSPLFAEWMMGLPAGHVTDVPGVGRNDQIRIIGGGVVPRQGIAAIESLTGVLFAPEEVAA